MKIGAVIVTFNPNIDKLISNINRTRQQVSKVVIVDNGSKNCIGIKKAISDSITVISLDSNEGIASAQNKGISYLQKKGFDWVLTLDQDTRIPLRMIEVFSTSAKIKDKKTGILAAQYDDINWSADQREKKLIINDDVVEKQMVISSGNLVRIEAWATVSGFDEKLFIDFVDFDFDAKLEMFGFKIWQFNNVIISHEIGEVIHKPKLERLLFLRKDTIISDHSAFREFYIQRNRIIFFKRYPQYKKHHCQILFNILAIRKVFIYNRPVISKLILSVRGLVQGIMYSPRLDSSFQDLKRRSSK